jgi:hypothetical protein
MKITSADTLLKPLEKIREVEPPATMLAAVRDAIETSKKERMAPAGMALCSIAFALLVAVNIMVTVRSSSPSSGNNAVRSLEIFTDNELYK